MYRPPAGKLDPNKLVSQRPRSQGLNRPIQSGGTVINCKPLRKDPNPALLPNQTKVLDHRDLRMESGNADRRKDTITAPLGILVDRDEVLKNNPEFAQTLAQAKEVIVWLEAWECKDVYRNRKTGIEIRNCKIIGINGRQWVLLPSNNRVPDFVMETLEMSRELNARYTQKLAPPMGIGGKRVIFSQGGVFSGRGDDRRMNAQASVFNDAMLGRPGVADGGVVAMANERARQAKEAYFQSLRTGGL